MSRELWGRVAGTVALAVCTGMISGGVAGWYAAHASVDPQISGLQQVFRDQLNAIRPTTPTTSTVEIVPVTPPAPLPSYPEVFLTRSVSPVLTLVRKNATNKNENGIVSSERTIGSAVALTADGWFATTASVFNNLRLNEVEVLWQGKLYPLVQGQRDTTTGAVFLKANIVGLPVTNLVRSVDVLPGTITWIEGKTSEIRPSMVTNVSVRATTTASTVSDLALRQFLLADAVPEGNGGAVWNQRGELVGLVNRDRPTDLARVLPANDLIQAFQSLLADREIRHATLGIRAVDLAQTVFDDGRAPSAVGVWVTSLQTNVPAIASQGPAAKVLQEGDVILRIERDLLDGRADIGERLLDYRPGSAVNIYGMRRGEPFQVLVTLGSAVTGDVLK
jgi:S1-C subfamily serine protease